MLKILSTKQIREADRETIEREPIASVDLMERAAGECVRWFNDHFDNNRPVYIFAGVGNNGGDALVMARRLMELGYNVSTYVVRYSENFSHDLQVNLDRLKRLGHEVNYLLEENQFPSISSESVIIDGLLGSGLNREAEGLAALCIEQINASIAEVVSIDMPSGLYADKVSPKDTPIITASYTLSFQVPKIAFFLPGNEEFTGKWVIIDIGLDAAYLNRVQSQLFFVDTIHAYKAFFQRGKFDHKGNYGHGLMIAGAYGKMGAAVLATRAAMRSGIGKITAHVPHLGNNIMQVAVPEAMTSVDDHDEFVGELPAISEFDAIGIGPGIGTNKKTRRLLKTLIGQCKVPLVLDADALNILAENSDYLKLLPSNTVLTPHTREFERLFGKSKNSYDRLTLLRDKAKELNIIIVLKGAHSAIATPKGDLFFNATGNPGMATAGSGDVLTGMILSVLSQVPDPVIATVCAVFLHGAAGDRAALKDGQHGVVASAIIDQIGPAIQQAIMEE